MPCKIVERNRDSVRILQDSPHYATRSEHLFVVIITGGMTYVDDARHIQDAYAALSSDADETSTMACGTELQPIAHSRGIYMISCIHPSYAPPHSTTPRSGQRGLARHTIATASPQRIPDTPAVGAPG